MICYGATDIGKKRHSNQDAFLITEISENEVLAVVCDGMGGANAGNLASQLAVKIISEYFQKSYRKNMDDLQIEKLLKNAIENANLEIYNLALQNEALNGMGTTAVAVFSKENTVCIAHVGDSRAYLISDNLTQLTRDHSIVQNLIESGQITPQDAKIHPRKNVITRALGVSDEVMADFNQVKPCENDFLLLCTDGLTGHVEENTIFEIIKNSPPESICENLINNANKNGGSDNITAVILAY